jgi:hypothetical protein
MRDPRNLVDREGDRDASLFNSATVPCASAQPVGCVRSPLEVKSIIALARLSLGCYGDAHGGPPAPAADGVARAAIASSPASEWPCGVRERSREGGRQIVELIDREVGRTNRVR